MIRNLQIKVQGISAENNRKFKQFSCNKLRHIESFHERSENDLVYP